MLSSYLARTLLVTATSAIALAVAVQAAGPVKSQWVSRDMTVDGRLDEWGELTVVEDGLAVAAANDADSLVLAVSTNHAATRAGLARGLILWLAPKQTTDFGVQFPATVDTQPGAGGRPLDPARLNDLDILGPGKARRLLTLTPELGLQAASGTVGDTLAFELKLPLMPSAARPRAVGVPAGRPFQLGLFTPELSRAEEAAREAAPAGSRTYGMGPIFGGPGTGIPLPDSSQKAPREERPRTLKTWTTISLASPPR